MTLIDQFDIVDCGSIVRFTPLTDDAQAWWDEYVNEGPGLGRSYCVAAHYAGPIVTGLWLDSRE